MASCSDSKCSVLVAPSRRNPGGALGTIGGSPEPAPAGPLAHRIARATVGVRGARARASKGSGLD
eukprot:scaffold270313_cov31-Tisochrysis_lutea.AAC.4